MASLSRISNGSRALLLIVMLLVTGIMVSTPARAATAARPMQDPANAPSLDR